MKVLRRKIRNYIIYNDDSLQSQCFKCKSISNQLWVYIRGKIVMDMIDHLYFSHELKNHEKN